MKFWGATFVKDCTQLPLLTRGTLAAFSSQDVIFRVFAGAVTSSQETHLSSPQEHAQKSHVHAGMHMGLAEGEAKHALAQIMGWEELQS